MVFSEGVTGGGVGLFFCVGVDFADGADFCGMVAAFDVPVGFLFFDVAGILVEGVGSAGVVRVFVYLVLGPLSVGGVYFVVVFYGFLAADGFSFAFGVGELPVCAWGCGAECAIGIAFNVGLFGFGGYLVVGGSFGGVGVFSGFVLAGGFVWRLFGGSGAV